MRHFFKKHLYPVLIFGVVALLFVINLNPGHYLSGWDNLQTELNPWLAVKRSLFAVWQEYQSFGLVAGNAHAADLVRAVFVALLTFFLPDNLVRYTYHGLMYLLGGWGAFYLLRYTGFKSDKLHLAFLGSLFYLLNFGILQLFYVPFEPFSHFFAFLPWEVLIFLKVLEPGGRKHIPMFILINALSTPQSYIQTIFVVYLLVLFCFTTNYLKTHFSLYAFKKILAVFAIIFFINSFWLLPQLYFLKTSGNVVREAKINQLATEDILYQNHEKGTLLNVLLMKGFYYELFNTKYQPLFLPWKKHFDNPLIWIFPFAVAGIMLAGFLGKNKYRLPFLLVIFFVALALLNSTPPFSWMNDILRRSDIINQIFRSPFTKFIFPYALAASYLFAAGLEYLHEQNREFFNKKNILIGVIAILVIYSLPAFRGHFYAETMQVKIPQSYFNVIDYFKNVDKNKRIAFLPEHTFWGWYFNRWGYDGSGFLWYGIEQPIVSRTFDVWSDKSESYFWEMKAAIEAESVARFENVIEKYDIDYLILDNTFLPVSSTLKGMQYDRVKNLLARSGRVKLISRNNELILYEVMHSYPNHSFITIARNLPNVGPAVKLTNEDSAFASGGTYMTSVDREYDAYFPYLDLTSQTRLSAPRWKIRDSFSDIIVETKLPIPVEKYYAYGSSQLSDSLIYKDGQLQNIGNKTNLRLDGDTLRALIPRQNIDNVEVSKTQVSNCSFRSGAMSFKETDQGSTVSTSNGAISCFGYEIPYLEQRYGYLVKVSTENTKGRNLFFYILDKTKKQSYIEERLRGGEEYFILTPMYQYGVGYNLTFHNNSYLYLDSVNTLKSLTIYSFPYEDLKAIVFKKPDIPRTSFSSAYTAKKYNYYTYSIELNSNESKPYLILNQSYHEGWKAYQVDGFNFLSTRFPFLAGREIQTHLLINNWANGWLAGPGNQKVVLIFWPQYLEYLGFILLSGAFITALYFKPRHKDRQKLV